MEEVSPLPNQSPAPTRTEVAPPISSSSPNKPLLIILLIVFVIILTSLNIYLFVKFQTPPSKLFVLPTPIVKVSPAPLPPQEPDVTNPPLPIKTIIYVPRVEWQTYSDAAGFSFQYPANIKLSLSGKSYLSDSPDQLTLDILVRKIDLITQEVPWRYSKDDALKDEALLQKGEFGNAFDFALPDSKELIKMGNINAKSFVVFGRFQTCDISFERQLVFYKNNYQIIISLVANGKEIVNGNPKYFNLASNPNISSCWKSPAENNQADSTRSIYEDIKKKTVSQPLLIWYDTFDQILSTFKFLD